MAREMVNRISGIIVIVIGIFLLGHAAYQEIHGVTYKPLMDLPFTRRSVLDRHIGTYAYRIPIEKTINPKLFREFMNIHWIWAAAVEAVGIFILAKAGE